MELTSVYIHPTAEVSPQAEVGAETRIWRQAHVREHAHIGENCNIGKGVYIDALPAPAISSPARRAYGLSPLAQTPHVRSSQ